MNNNLPNRHDIPSFWRPHGENAVFLHLGENPFPPTDRVRKAIIQASEHANRYPDTNCRALREKIAEYAGHGVSPENIIVGNGSDETIDLAIVSFCSPDGPAAIFTPTFFVYEFAALRHASPVVKISLAADFALPDRRSIPTDLAQQNYSISFIPNPNNPTGALTSRACLIDYLEHWPGIVVVDECYYEYSGETVVDLIHDYPNLLVFRSLSKSFGLSGLRLGYAAACRSIIEAMERHAMTFPINVCAQAAGIAALEDAGIYQRRIAEIIERRDKLQHALQDIGLETLPSYANFLMTLWPAAWMEKQPAKQLADRGVLVSDQTMNMNLGRPALRIGIGAEDENQRVIQEITGIFQKNP
ncbi:MAG: histidinol-phosphate transaminase [Candidatus Omnitrophica bacterium]|nr:histidinol-phosphate transaminase [Candidatus Omnitrophota bacterium]